MAAYAMQQREPSARGHSCSPNRLELGLSQAISRQTSSRPRGAVDAVLAESSVLDQLLAHIADRLAAAITDRLVISDNRPDEWFDSRHAAEYLGVHRDTLRKLAAERAIPPSRRVLAASSTSGGLTSTRGGTVADGLATSHRCWRRWRSNADRR
jgi:hypothetical protein